MRRLVRTATIFAGTLAMLAGSVMPTMAADPATSAPIISGSNTVSGGSMSVSMQRDRWGVIFKVTIKDTAADGDCIYAEVKVIVDDGTDPDAKVGSVCGKGKVDTFTKRIAGPKLGKAITGVEAKVCRSVMLVDPCAKVVGKTLPQHTRRGSDARIADMNKIETMSMADFLAKKKAHPAPYDWSDDGCSTPGLDAAWAPWRSRFVNACKRHDWGYYNFGQAKTSGLTTWFDATDARRRSIDDRFLSDMRTICKDHLDWGLASCYAWAEVFYKGVRSGGGYGFYH